MWVAYTNLRVINTQMIKMHTDAKQEQQTGWVHYHMSFETEVEKIAPGRRYKFLHRIISTPMISPFLQDLFSCVQLYFS